MPPTTQFKLTPQQARAEWVKALRSGKYEQGKHVLCDVSEEGKPRYCCLGVACEVYQSLEGGLTVRDPLEGGLTVRDRGDDKEYDGHLTTLPPVVVDWLGMNSRIGIYQDAGNRRYLTQDNDSGVYTFARIADTIENTPSLWVQQ